MSGHFDFVAACGQEEQGVARDHEEHRWAREERRERHALAAAPRQCTPDHVEVEPDGGSLTARITAQMMDAHTVRNAKSWSEAPKRVLPSTPELIAESWPPRSCRSSRTSDTRPLATRRDTSNRSAAGTCCSGIAGCRDRKTARGRSWGTRQCSQPWLNAPRSSRAPRRPCRGARSGGACRCCSFLS